MHVTTRSRFYYPENLCGMVPSGSSGITEAPAQDSTGHFVLTQQKALVMHARITAPHGMTVMCHRSSCGMLVQFKVGA